MLHPDAQRALHFRHRVLAYIGLLGLSKPCEAPIPQGTSSVQIKLRLPLDEEPKTFYPYLADSLANLGEVRVMSFGLTPDKLTLWASYEEIP